jgi:protein O-mannosyl-transferase
VASTSVELSQNPPRRPWSVFADSPTRTVLLGFLLIMATVAVYSPVRSHPFFNLDDGLYVVDNVHVHNGLDRTTVKWAFTTFNMQNWIPLSLLSHAVDYRLFGSNPAGHHQTNTLLHALNAALLFWVLKRATGYAGRSFMVAALFAFHPMNVEAVAWVAERKTDLSMVFFLLALGAYRWYAREPRVGRYALVALLFALGLTAKAQVITLPFVLLLWDYWPLQRMFPPAQGSFSGLASNAFLPRSLRQLVEEKVPLLFLCWVDAMFTLRADAGARPQLWLPLSMRLGNAVFSYARYIAMAIWPTRLAPLYPFPGNSLTIWQVLGALILLIAISALVIAGRHHRYLPVGWFWFLGTLVPMIKIIQFGKDSMADRFAYQALIGLFIMICWGLSDWAERLRISAAWLVGASAVV